MKWFYNGIWPQIWSPILELFRAEILETDNQSSKSQLCNARPLLYQASLLASLLHSFMCKMGIKILPTLQVIVSIE